jgi:hypothetical protein
MAPRRLRASAESASSETIDESRACAASMLPRSTSARASAAQPRIWFCSIAARARSLRSAASSLSPSMISARSQAADASSNLPAANRLRAALRCPASSSARRRLISSRDVVPRRGVRPPGVGIEMGILPGAIRDVVTGAARTFRSIRSRAFASSDRRVVRSSKRSSGLLASAFSTIATIEASSPGHTCDSDAGVP